MRQPPPLNSRIREQEPYPFAHLDALKREAVARGVDIIDLSIGDPGEVPSPGVVEALKSGMAEPSTYPRALGRRDFRAAAADWLKRRFGVTCDPERHVLPTNGSKEAIFHLPLVCLDVEKRPGALIPNPGYPVYALGIKSAGGTAIPLELRKENAYLPDLSGIPGDLWGAASMLWVNYPHNPTGAEAPGSFLGEAAQYCRDHGVLLASDEAYCDTYFGEPPSSALEHGLQNIVALFTLSKRSALPGLRSGFIAGDETVIDALKKQRPGFGVATPDFVQQAAITAWEDESHTESLRREFAGRHALLCRGLRDLGYEVGESKATIYVWALPPRGESEEACAERLLKDGVVVVPGAALGSAGKGYLRFSITQTPERLREALRRMGGR